jgi:hypothetical protein
MIDRSLRPAERLSSCLTSMGDAVDLILSMPGPIWGTMGLALGVEVEAETDRAVPEPDRSHDAKDVEYSPECFMCKGAKIIETENGRGVQLTASLRASRENRHLAILAHSLRRSRFGERFGGKDCGSSARGI